MTRQGSQSPPQEPPPHYHQVVFLLWALLFELAHALQQLTDARAIVCSSFRFEVTFRPLHVGLVQEILAHIRCASVRLQTPDHVADATVLTELCEQDARRHATPHCRQEWVVVAVAVLVLVVPLLQHLTLTRADRTHLQETKIRLHTLPKGHCVAQFCSPAARTY